MWRDDGATILVVGWELVMIEMFFACPLIKLTPVVQLPPHQPFCLCT